MCLSLDPVPLAISGHSFTSPGWLGTVTARNSPYSLISSRGSGGKPKKAKHAPTAQQWPGAIYDESIEKLSVVHCMSLISKGC